jgi:hypothetical protein
VKKHTVATLLAAFVTLVAIPWAKWATLEILQLREGHAKLRLAVFGVAAQPTPAPPARAPAGGEQLAYPVPNFSTRKETRHDEGSR